MKRLELYTGWKCNQKCTYCSEYPIIMENWDRKIEVSFMLKQLIKYKMKGYNHVTFLGGEPLIQENFFEFLLLGKKLGFKILVTTNATLLHIENIAEKYLPLIDELIISLEGVDKDLQRKISRSKNYVLWDKVFQNIKKYWHGNYLKSNIVITQDNLSELYNLVKFSYENGINNIAVTYPDLLEEGGDYSLEYYKKYVSPSYSDCLEEINKIIKYSKDNKINLRIADFPLCLFPHVGVEELLEYFEDYNYDGRLKLSSTNEELNRVLVGKHKKLPRRREHIDKCRDCAYKDICWGPSITYDGLYGYDEIHPIKKK